MSRMHLLVASLLLPQVSISEYLLGELSSVYTHCAMLLVPPSTVTSEISQASAMVVD